MNKKAIIAMSGGVDSSVAAFLTKQQGYECIGATMDITTVRNAYGRQLGSFYTEEEFKGIGKPEYSAKAYIN